MVLDELPDLFAWPDGRGVEAPAEWPARAGAWRDLVVEVGYGGLLLLDVLAWRWQGGPEPDALG